MDSSKISKNAKMDELNDIKYILENKVINNKKYFNDQWSQKL